MKLVDGLLCFTLYLFSMALFTSMAALTAYHFLMIVLVTFFTIYYLKKGEFKLVLSQKALLLYALVAFLSLVVNAKLDRISVEFNSLTRILVAPLIPFVLIYFSRFEKFDLHIKRMLGLFLLSTCIAHIAGIYGWVTGFNPVKLKAAADETRAAGLYSMAITYGYGVQFLTLVLLGLLIEHKFMSKYVRRHWLLFSAVLSMAGLIFSLTRGAYIGFAFALPFLFMRTSPKLFRLSMLGFAAIILMSATIMLKMPESNRLSYRSESNLIRISQYQTAWYAFKEKPIWGHGFRQFSAEVARIKNEHNLGYKYFVGNSHNNIVEALVTTGLIGFLCYVLFLVFWLREIVQSNHVLKPTVMAVWVAFLVSGLFQTTFLDAENIYFLSMVYAIHTALCRSDNPLNAAREKVSYS